MLHLGKRCWRAWKVFVQKGLRCCRGATLSGFRRRKVNWDHCRVALATQHGDKTLIGATQTDPMVRLRWRLYASSQLKGRLFIPTKFGGVFLPVGHLRGLK